MDVANFFVNLNRPDSGERFETLLSRKNLVIERIVSSSYIQPVEYIQPQDEWVMLVQGEAELVVAGESVHLAAGDYLFIPAEVPHSVAKVSQGAIWLAVHLHPEPTS